MTSFTNGCCRLMVPRQMLQNGQSKAMMIPNQSKPKTRVQRLIPFMLAVLLPVIMIWACAPQRIVSIEPAAVGSGEALFSKAEDLYASSAYEQALFEYQAYLARFPKGPLADAASRTRSDS